MCRNLHAEKGGNNGKIKRKIGRCATADSWALALVMDRCSNARGAGVHEQIHHFMFLSLILFISLFFSLSLSVVLLLLCCCLLYFFLLFASFFTVSDHAIRKPREIKKGLKEE